MNDFPIVLVPAYGRKYKTDEAAVQDYLDGWDFKLVVGSDSKNMTLYTYCSSRDFLNLEVSIFMGVGKYIKVTAKHVMYPNGINKNQSTN